MILKNNVPTLQNNLFLGVILSTACLLIALAFQGFDVCDEGWYLSFYQQFFKHPETVEYNFAFWLTGLIGGTWYAAFPQGGILSFRILAVLFLLGSMTLSYRILKGKIPKTNLIIGLLIVLFVNDFGYLAFYYNQASSLILLLSILFTLRGIEKGNGYALGVAGFLTGINVFSRLPNLTLFVMIAAIPLQLVWQKNHKKCTKHTLVYLLGAGSAFLATYTVLRSMGHLEIMKNSILGIFQKAGNPDSNHNLKTLLNVYLSNYKSILTVGFKMSVSVLIFDYLWRPFQKKPLFKIAWSLLALLVFASILSAHSIHALYFFGFVGSLSVSLSKSATPVLKTTALMGTLMMVFLPLGSDGGIVNAGYTSIWLTVPLFFRTETLRQYQRFWSGVNFKKWGGLDLKNKPKYVFTLLITAYFLNKSYALLNEAYFDKGSRFDKTHVVNSELAKGIHTTKRRAKITNELLHALKKFVRKGDYLLAYDNLPMVHFLTDTKPYMYTSWIWVYDSHKFEKQLKRAEREIEKRPIVVQQKFQTIGSFSAPMTDYMDPEKEESYLYKKGRVRAMNSFLKRNPYQLVWSNAYFNIFKASTDKTDK
jgi:hypothetical protein